MKDIFPPATVTVDSPFPLAISSQPVTSPTVLAQVDPDQDVMLKMQEGFDNFIESGQVWALLIGFFLGYLLRSLTAY